MDQRLSLVTLGYDDVEAAAAFFERLGWKGESPNPTIRFFQCNSIVVAIWDRASLAEDSCRDDAGGWGGITLAYNVGSPAEVDRTLEEAERAGAEVARKGAETFWGGYSGVFIDPGGHAWEVAHNPYWTIGDDGSVSIT